MRINVYCPLTLVLGYTLVTVGCGELVEDVPVEVCASGKRWVGEKTGHEEMYPGRDCVSCHRENDGPPLLAGGTVYGVYDTEGTRTVANDCFGLEGATVTLTGADGRIFSTRTNRAGNFFFEGDSNSLVKPYSAVVEYELPDGRLSRQPMDSSPSYGGCAQCHGTSAPRTSERCPGGVLEAAEVFPVTPLYTGVSSAPNSVPQDQECVP